MAHPRIRDVVSIVTTLPASIIIAVCLFLPQTQSCNGRVETAAQSGTWVAILPIIVLGLLPLLWRIAPARETQAVPELLLALTLLVMAMSVVTIPVAIWLMWGYSKRAFRGELLAAMCCAALVMMWLFAFPLLLVFSTWLPAAAWTWGAAGVELVGMFAWASAAAARFEPNVDDAPRLQTKRSALSFLRFV